MSNHCSQNLNSLGLKNTLTATFKNTRFLNLPNVLIMMMACTLLLVGCGQKGNLYLEEEAPSNTDFIIYKANKPDSESSADNKSKRKIEQQKIEEAAAEAPLDY